MRLLHKTDAKAGRTIRNREGLKIHQTFLVDVDTTEEENFKELTKKHMRNYQVYDPLLNLSETLVLA